MARDDRAARRPRRRDPRRMIRRGRMDGYLAVADAERARGDDALRTAHEAVSLAGVWRGAAVLDAGMGQGWHAVALAPAFGVTGIDLEPRLVREARRRAALAGAAPRLLQGSTTSLPLPDGAFDLALSLATSFGYGEPDDDRATFAELARVLRPGAPLVVQAVSAESAERRGSSRRSFPGGIVAEYLPTFDRAEQLLTETQTVTAPGRPPRRFSYTVRAYDLCELAAMLREAGFHRLAAFGSLAGDARQPGDPLHVVATASL